MSDYYKIKIRGHLDRAWCDYWLDEFNVSFEDNGQTIITGPIIDQPALYGLLNKIRDLGLTLLLVEQIELPTIEQPSRIKNV